MLTLSDVVVEDTQRRSVNFQKQNPPTLNDKMILLLPSWISASLSVSFCGMPKDC